MTENTATGDRRTIYTVALTLALTVLVVVVGDLALAAMHVTAPSEVVDLAQVALGGLVGLLAKTSVDPAQLPAPDPNAANPPEADPA